jgi:hypothetical protein
MILVDDLVVRVGLWGLGSVYIFPGEMKNKKCKTVILEFRIKPVHHLAILELSIKSPCLWTVCFYLVIPNHFLGLCYACLDMLWVLRICNMWLGMLCALGTFITWKVVNAKTCSSITEFVLENMKGAKGRLGGKMAAVLLYWLHLISLADLTFCLFQWYLQSNEILLNLSLMHKVRD